MVWVFLVATIQIMGFIATLTRLAYDEWEQWRLTNAKPTASEDRQHSLEFQLWKATATM